MKQRAVDGHAIQNKRRLVRDAARPHSHQLSQLFFPADARSQFSGVRLARDLD